MAIRSVFICVDCRTTTKSLETPDSCASCGRTEPRFMAIHTIVGGARGRGGGSVGLSIRIEHEFIGPWTDEMRGKWTRWFEGDPER